MHVAARNASQNGVLRAARMPATCARPGSSRERGARVDVGVARLLLDRRRHVRASLLGGPREAREAPGPEHAARVLPGLRRSANLHHGKGRSGDFRRPGGFVGRVDDRNEAPLLRLVTECELVRHALLLRVDLVDQKRRPRRPLRVVVRLHVVGCRCCGSGRRRVERRRCYRDGLHRRSALFADI